MTHATVVYGGGTIALVTIALLVRAGRLPGMAEVRRRGLIGRMSGWTFVGAGCAALTWLTVVVQRAVPGDADVYTLLRLTLAAGMIAVMVRIVVLLR